VDPIQVTFKKKLDIDLKHLTPSTKGKLQDLICKWKAVFSILFLSGDLTLTTLGQTPKVPFVSSTHSVTAVSKTVFDLHIPDTVKTDIGPTWICRGKYVCYLSVRQYDGYIIGCT
jgi:hypothetical protein